MPHLPRHTSEKPLFSADFLLAQCVLLQGQVLVTVDQPPRPRGPGPKTLCPKMMDRGGEVYRRLSINEQYPA